MTGGHRRIDRVLDPGFLDDLKKRPLAEVVREVGDLAQSLADALNPPSPS